MTLELSEILIDIASRYDLDIEELFKLYMNGKNIAEKKNNVEIVFCDGASNQKNKGSIGVFFKDGDPRNIGKMLNIDKPTNNKAELYAIMEVLKIVKPNKNLIIYTDSAYSINSLTKWYKNWIKNGWKTKKGENVLNKELIIKILKMLENRNVKFKHTKAHTKKPTNKNSEEYKIWYGNHMADYLATHI